jgi:hypothetical protein
VLTRIAILASNCVAFIAVGCGDPCDLEDFVGSSKVDQGVAVIYTAEGPGGKCSLVDRELVFAELTSPMPETSADDQATFFTPQQHLK